MRNFLVVLLLLSLSGTGYAELRILGEESPPGEYLDPHGNPAGVTVDLVKELLGRVGCLKMLEAGRVRFFYTSDIGMDGLLKEQGVALNTFAAMLELQKEYLYLAFSNDVDDCVIDRWEAALEAVKADGTLAGIYHGIYPEETIKEICLPGDPLEKGE